MVVIVLVFVIRAVIVIVFVVGVAVRKFWSCVVIVFAVDQLPSTDRTRPYLLYVCILGILSPVCGAVIFSLQKQNTDNLLSE